MRRSSTVIALAGLLLALLSVVPSATASIQGDFARAARMLREWRFQDAKQAVSTLAARAPDAPETRYLQAELAFLHGDYAAAVARLDGLADTDVYGSVGQLRSIATTTDDATSGFARYESPGGHFVVVYQPGKDEVLVELTAEVLERAYEVLGDDLGHRPPDKIRVEILPQRTDLARVSTLTVTEIETTGTIALCKYNKLMVVSPRDTLFGYSWMDTLVHEYVHYVVSQASRDRVPIWLQEGIARFEQTRWRTAAGVQLSAVEEHLLANALKTRRLITFEEMHPSMAKLPSQEAAALAFAEVYTMIGFIHDEVGYTGLRRAIALIRDGRSARRAVAEVLDTRWRNVTKDWQKSLRKRKLRSSSAAGGRTQRIRFRKTDSKPDENAGVDMVAEKARGHARLGGLLRSRGMSHAAAVEYEKALAAVPEDPWVQAKLSRTYLELGRHDEAVRIAEPLLEADDSDAAPATTLGIAYLALGRLKDARTAFEVALRVQPFDPAVRCGLADTLTQLGQHDLAQRERRACSTLGTQ